MEFRFTTTFTTIAKIVSPSDEDRFVAKASLAPLKSMLPADIDPAESPDLLFFSCNGAVAGLVNKNQDAISCETALQIYNTAKNKYVSTDHDREKVVGVVLYPGFSKFGSNEALTFEQASEAKEPFNMAFAGVLWKVINPMLSKYLASNGGIGDDSLSMSWEIAFNSYSIGVGSKNLFDAQIIKADDPNFAAYDRYLRSNKGEGKDPSGKEVFRVIGNDSVILGYSIVANPAAEVKGILPIKNAEVDDSEDDTDDTDDTDNTANVVADNFNEIPESQRGFLQQGIQSVLGFDMCDIVMQDGTIFNSVPVIGCRYLPKGIDGNKIASITICQKNEEKNITSSNASVNINTVKTMKISNLQEFESVVGKFKAEAAEAAAAVDFVKEIQKASEKYAQDLKAQEDLVKQADETKASVEKKAKELEAAYAEIKRELDEIKANAAEVAEAQKFQERMASFDETFELDADDIKIIASDIKELSDEAFASYLTKSKKLMAAKMKKVKADPQDGDGDDDEDDKKKKAKAAKKADDDADDDDEDGDEDDGEKDGKKKKGMKASLIKAAIASLVEEKQSQLPRDPVNTDNNVIADMAEAFGTSFKVNGKAVKSTKKK
jgi:hypothetical protein